MWLVAVVVCCLVGCEHYEGSRLGKHVNNEFNLWPNWCVMRLTAVFENYVCTLKISQFRRLGLQFVLTSQEPVSF
jgi:hypothetical protein